MKKRMSVNIKFILISILAIMTSGCANVPPVADAGSNQKVTAYSTVTLDGSNSADVDDDTLSFNWSLATVPSGSTATLSDTTAKTPTFRPDIEGVYLASLVVNDGGTNSVADNVTIVVFKQLVNNLTNVGSPYLDALEAQIELIEDEDSELIDELSYCD